MINEAKQQLWTGFETLCQLWAETPIDGGMFLTGLCCGLIMIAVVRSFTHARVC